MRSIVGVQADNQHLTDIQIEEFEQRAGLSIAPDDITGIQYVEQYSVAVRRDLFLQDSHVYRHGKGVLVAFDQEVLSAAFDIVIGWVGYPENGPKVSLIKSTEVKTAADQSELLGFDPGFAVSISSGQVNP